MTNTNPRTAYVVEIDGRFFATINTRGAMRTTPNLPGAKLFSDARDAVEFERLARIRGRNSQVLIIGPKARDKKQRSLAT